MAYKVKRVDDFELNAKQMSAIWQLAEVAEIKRYQWDASDYEPEVVFRILYSKTAIYVRFEVKEDAIVAKALKTNDAVCKDSCVEFFFAPEIKKDLMYFNLEMNCCGKVLMAYGTGRGLGEERVLLEERDIEKIEVSKTVVGDTKMVDSSDVSWAIEYKMPFEVLKDFVAIESINSGDQWKANLYKCGDDLPRPHYGMWAPVVKEKPDFHRPESFEVLVFE